MFSFHQIQITNFRSYKGSHSFTFPTENGIYFFTGKNLMDDLGANGAGKTTFIDAITWCLYGSTTRGLRANDVLPNWEGTGCCVELELSVANRRSVVFRSQKPNNLQLDGKPVDQTELESYLRLNYESFLHSVLNAQFGTSFFSLTPSAKLTLFSDIMNLDHWLKLSGEASDHSVEIGEEIDQVDKKVNRLISKMAILDADFASLGKKETEYELQRDKVAQHLELELNTAIRDERRAEEYLVEKLLVDKQDLMKQIKAASKAEKEAQKRRDICLVALQDRASSRTNVEKQLEGAIADKKRAEAFNEDICPLCGCEVTAEHLAKTIRIRGNLVSSYKEQLTRMDTNYQATHKTFMQAKMEYERAVAHREELELQFSGLIIEITKAESAHEHYAEIVASYNARRKELSKEVNPYTALLNEKSAEFQKTEHLLDTSKELLERLKADYEAVFYWVKGFKQIRLHIIEQAFQALQLEVNNSLTQLGLHDWEITFDIERENKSGGVTKGFMVFVKSPQNKEPVKWENWSGGETQRLQLAGDLGLANLIMQQAGLYSTIEMFDEPSTHLSQEGMYDLANLLHERAINEGKCIWIVDHAAIQNFGEFQGIITARKDANGSQLNYTPS